MSAGLSLGNIARLLALALLVASAGCSSVPYYDYKLEKDPRGAEFVIGPLDQLSVVAWKNRELSADVTVRPDGIITLPLIGDVKAADRTPSDLRKDIAKRYGAFVRDEELVLSVGVVAVNSYQFTVLGSVEHGGLLSSRTYLTVVEALAMAGGPNRFAGTSLYIVRGTPTRRIPIDIRRITSGEHPEENLVVLRGDLIVVP